jgi:hypothetical protein
MPIRPALLLLSLLFITGLAAAQPAAVAKAARQERSAQPEKVSLNIRDLSSEYGALIVDSEGIRFVPDPQSSGCTGRVESYIAYKDMLCAFVDNRTGRPGHDLGMASTFWIIVSSKAGNTIMHGTLEDPEKNEAMFLAAQNLAGKNCSNRFLK